MIVYDWESKGHIPEGAYEVCKGEVKVRLGNYLEAGGGGGECNYREIFSL